VGVGSLAVSAADDADGHAMSTTRSPVAQIGRIAFRLADSGTVTAAG
jgi:hypothetical protein